MNFDKRDLDNYITGHYGEDQFRDEDDGPSDIEQCHEAVEKVMQANCYHNLTRKDVPAPYRYRCLTCNKLLKIMSGYYKPEPESDMERDRR